MIVGTECSCGVYLYSDEPDNIKQVEKEVADEAFFFSNANKPKDEKTFKEFVKHKGRIMNSKAFVKFVKYEVSNERLLDFITKPDKTRIFVNHMENHLLDLNLKGVVCKICGKTIDEIYEEEKNRI